MRKTNTRQLTTVKPIFNNVKKQFYFRCYCLDINKDGVTKFANTEA